VSYSMWSGLAKGIEEGTFVDPVIVYYRLPVVPSDNNRKFATFNEFHYFCFFFSLSHMVEAAQRLLPKSLQGKITGRADVRTGGQMDGRMDGQSGIPAFWKPAEFKNTTSR
jgi:hypothetical protein